MFPAASRRLAALAGILLFAQACTRHESEEGLLLGILERDRIELSATAAEPLTAILVREGQRVEKGQLLALLDEARMVASLDGAQARLRGIEARRDELLRGGRDERRTEARAALESDTSELELARLEVRRLERLVLEDVASHDLLDAARTRVATAEARIAQNRARLAELLAGATEEQLRQVEAELDVARAAIDELEIARARLTLVAPVDAVVEALPWELGETPGVGRPVVVLVADTRPWVRAYVPEDRMASLPVGTSFRLEADGLAESLTGCLRFVARDAAFTPHYGLSEHDRHRLAFAAEIEVHEAEDEVAELLTGLPIRAIPQPGRTCATEADS